MWVEIISCIGYLTGLNIVFIFFRVKNYKTLFQCKIARIYDIHVFLLLILEAINRNFMIVVRAIVSQYQIIRMRDKVETIFCKTPHKWLNNMWKRDQSSLMNYRFRNLIGVFPTSNIRFLWLQYLLLLDLYFWQVILLQLLEIVISWYHNFFSIERNAERVCCKSDIP